MNKKKTYKLLNAYCEPRETLIPFNLQIPCTWAKKKQQTNK